MCSHERDTLEQALAECACDGLSAGHGEADRIGVASGAPDSGHGVRELTAVVPSAPAARTFTRRDAAERSEHEATRATGVGRIGHEAAWQETWAGDGVADESRGREARSFQSCRRRHEIEPAACRRAAGECGDDEGRSAAGDLEHALHGADTPAAPCEVHRRAAQPTSGNCSCGGSGACRRGAATTARRDSRGLLAQPPKLCTSARTRAEMRSCSSRAR